jgi:uncharacterized protein YfaP (DUF2135 family)
VITAPGTAAAGGTGLAASVPEQAGATYAWTIANGTIVAGDGTRSITFSAGSAGTLALTCTASNSAGASDPGGCSLTVVAAPAAATFTPGTRTTLATATIGAAGGTLSGPAGTPLAGVSVTFPAGALPSDQTVTLGYDTGTLVPLHGTPGGTVIALDPGQVRSFDQPVSITIPYDPAGGVPVPYTIDAAGALQACQLVGLDATRGTAVFETFHASLYTWILDLLGLGDIWETNFVPMWDGFQVDNNGSYYNRTGESLGMSAFALWYYQNVAPIQPNFYSHYMTQVGTDAAGSPRLGQQVIATRAFITASRIWNTYLPKIQGARRLPDFVNYQFARNALENTRQAQLLYLRTTASPNRSLVVLATGWDNSGLVIYDPGVHGITVTIDYDRPSRVFDAYEGYDRVDFVGAGLTSWADDFTLILADAEAGFHGSANTTVQIASHTSGETVTDRIQMLTGTVTSGQVQASKLSVFVNSTEFQTDVANDGTFHLTVTLASGTNHLLFVPKGYDAQNRLINLPSNLDLTDFTLVANVTASVILTTLTWDTGGTDLDTYVVDPAGDYSCYYHRTTADGGYLDYDYTAGYGPEHWQLTTANTVRWGQGYRVRVHYYSDHGNGPTNYTMAIQLYDGAEATTQYYRGNLSASSTSNTGPAGTGADWADIATVVPVQGAAAGSSSRQFDGSLVITVPVPPPGTRQKP